MHKCPPGHTSETRQIVVRESLFADLKGIPHALEICAVCGVVFDSARSEHTKDRTTK